MSGVDHLWAGDAGEQVLGPAGKADDLVGEGGAENDKTVVFQRLPVEADGRVVAQRWMPSVPGNVLDLRFGEHADLHEGVGVFAGVVEQADVFIGRLALLRRDAHQPTQCPLAERRVCAWGDYKVKLSGVVHDFGGSAEQEGQRQRASVV